MKAIAIIPARMGSSRFPGKPLVPIHGLPMFLHVYYRAKLCRSISDVYIATPDDEIRKIAEHYDAKVIMTKDSHERCTDRVAEAAEKLVASNEVVVNIQGDEPLLYPELVDRIVEILKNNTDEVCVCPIVKIDDIETFQNKNVVKVVTDLNGYSLYMTREPIPTMVRFGQNIPMWQLIVILGFRASFLQTFTRLPQTPLEIAESIDYLRMTEHGYKIKTFVAPHPTIGVDVPSDVQRVEEMMISDPLTKLYLPMING